MSRSTRKLVREANFFDADAPEGWPWSAGDAFYETLIAAHRGLDDQASQALNARLILLLANHIGDLQVLREALAAACEDR